MLYMQTKSVLFSRSFSHYFVYDQRDGSVARHVAGSPETVHGDVECDHQCLCRLVEAEHRLQDTECRHDGSSRNARCGYHRDAQHKDESGKQREVERIPCIIISASAQATIFSVLPDR